MKFLHLADLHIGKSICEHSMLDEQRHALEGVLAAVDSEKPDAVLIAGDVYDKSIPSGEAVSVLDDFLVGLAARKVPTFVLSGNHDSAERLAFGGRLMERSGVYVSPVYDGTFTPVTLKDEFGEVDVWMLPFVRPAMVRAFLETEEEREMVKDYTSAIRMALSKMNFTEGRRNVLLAHEYVANAVLCESEDIVGGLDGIDVSVFDGFDYVALGHIHKPQNVRKDADGTVRVRYCGTPLKYSLSEEKHEKSITVVELGASPALTLRTIPFVPLHDVRGIRGTFAELVSEEFRTRQVAEGKSLEDFVYVTLTDENDVLDAAAKLRAVYPNLMMLMYDNERTRSQQIVDIPEKVERKSPMELFGEFFEEMSGRGLNAEEGEFVQDIITKIWEEN